MIMFINPNRKRLYAKSPCRSIESNLGAFLLEDIFLLKRVVGTSTHLLNLGSVRHLGFSQLNNLNNRIWYISMETVFE